MKKTVEIKEKDPVRDTVALLDNYIKIAYEVNVLNASINSLINCSYSKHILVICDTMRNKMAQRIDEGHKASQAFLNATYKLEAEQKERLAVILNERAAQQHQGIEELLFRISQIEATIRESNGVVPNIVEGVIPTVSPRRNIHNDENETLYIKTFNELEEHEFAFNLYTNYAAYLGYTRNQMRK
jgi:hypothetical protein